VTPLKACRLLGPDVPNLARLTHTRLVKLVVAVWADKHVGVGTKYRCGSGMEYVAPLRRPTL
jgi:hypothetical protein